MIETKASHVFLLDDVKAWLAGHGVNINDVVEVTIRVGRPSHEDHVAAWADVVFCKGDDRGYAYWNGGDDGEVARGQVSIPLKSLPTLVSADSLAEVAKAG